MDELFGNTFGDDLFEENTKKSNVVVESYPNWSPHRCEPQWFLKDESRPFQNEASAMNKKHSIANFLYYTGKYDESSKIFNELINLSTPGNHLLRRELYEGLARSEMKKGNIDEAISAANSFELNCKSKLHLTSFHVLCSEIFHMSMDSIKELNHLQQAINLNPLNSDFWLKLAKCYLSIAGQSFSGTEVEESTDADDQNSAKQLFPMKLSTKKDISWLYAASLIRFEIIIRSVSGKAETFTKKRGQIMLNEVRSFIKSIPQGFKEKTYYALSRDVYNVEQQRENAGFVDLGSSSRATGKNASEEENLLLNNLQTKEYQPDRFEDHWFTFLNSMKDEDLL